MFATEKHNMEKNIMKLRYIAAIVFIAVLGYLLFISLQGGGGTSQPKPPAATLLLKPDKGTHTVGQTWPVEIWLDTNTLSVDGVDVILQFDPSILRVVDKSIDTNGGIFSMVPMNVVDNEKGKIMFSAVVRPGEQYKGKGKIGAITLEGRTAGLASMSFVSEPDSTIDTNVAAGGADVLGITVNGKYEIVSD
jgi:hypothetical protein